MSALVAGTLAVVGCGGGGGGARDAATATVSAASERPAATVVKLSRTIGSDPMTDEVVVSADRHVEVRLLRGGAGARFRHFRLRSAELVRLRGALARLAARRDPTPRLVVGRWFYTVRVGARVPWYFRDGRVPARARAALDQLGGLIDTAARRDPGG